MLDTRCLVPLTFVQLMYKLQTPTSVLSNQTVYLGCVCTVFATPLRHSGVLGISRKIRNQQCTDVSRNVCLSVSASMYVCRVRHLCLSAMPVMPVMPVCVRDVSMYAARGMQ